MNVPRLRRARAHVPEPPRPPEALRAEERYIETLRERVAWQARVADEPATAAAGDEGAATAAIDGATGAVPAVDRRDPTLWQLERLVSRHGDAFPDRLEEWSSVLFALRPYAEPDGRLPHDVADVVAEIFAPLLA